MNLPDIYLIEAFHLFSHLFIHFYTGKLFKFWKFRANGLREKLHEQLRIQFTGSGWALCDRQPGWHLGTVFIIHSEVAAVQQLFLRSAPLSSPSSSVCQKAELMSTEEEDLNICPHSRNVTAVISNVGALRYFLFFSPGKTAFKGVFVFRSLVTVKRCVFDPPLN